MQPLELTLNEGDNGEDSLTTIMRGVLDCSPSLEGLIDNWVIQNGYRLELLQVEDDGDGLLNDPPASDVFGVVLCRERNKIATAFFKKDELRRNYPDILPITDYIASRDDEENIGAWRKSLGIRFSKTLDSNVGPLQALFPVVLSYVLSDRGSIILCPASDWAEEHAAEIKAGLDSEGFCLSQLISICELYSNPVSGTGFLSQTYISTAHSV